MGNAREKWLLRLAEVHDAQDAAEALTCPLQASAAWETAATKAYNVAYALVTYADYMAEVHGCPASARSLRDKSAEWFETGDKWREKALNFRRRARFAALPPN